MHFSKDSIKDWYYTDGPLVSFIRRLITSENWSTSFQGPFPWLGTAPPPS